MAEDYQYFILTRAENSYSVFQPGRICYISTKKHKSWASSDSLNVQFIGAYSALNYPVQAERLQPISREEAELLMALPEEDRLSALNQPQGLRSARRLREGTEVWVKVGSDYLKGTIRYIGNILKSTGPTDLKGVFYGIELQGSDRGRGTTDGSFGLKQFFSCDMNCGVFASFNKITAVGPQISPDPPPREGSGLKLEMRQSLKSKSKIPDQRSHSNQDQDQPMSFFSNHFHKDPSQREYRPESYGDSEPKSLSVDPEPMDQDHVYEDPDQLRELTKGFNRSKSNSVKQGPVPDKSKIDRKDKPKIRLDSMPGTAKRTAVPVPEPRPESRSESKEADHVKSWAEVAKTRLANVRSPRLAFRPQSETEPKTRPRTGARSEPESKVESPGGPKPGLSHGSTETELRTGDRVLFFDEKDQTLKGTFLYTEDTDRGPMTHIKVDSERSIVIPLEGIMKMDPEGDDMYANPKGAPGLEFEHSKKESRPYMRPEFGEPDHKKSWSEAVKTRSETEPKTRPRTGARSEPESKVESPEGPKPGLRHGSTETELRTGDRVLFFDEKDQTVNGTFLYTEETDRGPMTHIKVDSERSIVIPLEGIMKLDPEGDDMYANPKGAPGLEFEESKTHTIPESKEPDHKMSETVKTRTEAEPTAKPWTRPESRPEARQDSPEGPRPGLGQGSTDGLTVGDRVRFLAEKEQVLEGTVVFMEDSDEGTVVHIAGNSGAFFVPLHCVTEMDPKTNSADLYMDPDSMASPVEHQEGFSSLGVDSVVEIDLAKGGKGFGTIRWIGFIPEVQHKMAGLELEEKKGVSDGTFMGKRFFVCPERHALFVKLSSCRPDSRFCRTSANHDSPYTADSANQNIRNGKEHSGPRTGPHHNGFTAHQSTDDADDLEPVPPITTENVERLLIGRMRGIQGHHNSCYMDSALFSLFSVSSVLDSLLFKSTSTRDAEVQRILLQNIVNPLRRNGFVEGRHVMNLRKQLQKHGFSQSFTTDEKDPEEFLTVIMQHILNLDPLLKLSSGGKVQDSFCFQIFLDQTQDLVLPSVQQLLEHSFHSNKLKLSEVPSCLILQMPRFGKKFKMFDKILPSLELDVTDLLLQGPKQCILCGEAALWECPGCFLDPVFSSNGVKLFCDQCRRQVHKHSRRQSHRPDRLDTHHHGQSEHFHGNRDKLHLLAVLCIETSHYVSFIKYGPEPQHWLFFDSMADREGEADGYNVPQVTLAPEVSQYLDMSLSELANQVPRDMKGVAKRLICDAYLYLYQSPALHLYT